MEVRVTGVMFQYYHVCERELWFFAHRITPKQEDENILMGRFIEENFYERKGQELELPGVKMDLIKRKDRSLAVFEITKSTKLLEPKKWQLLYYLYNLKKAGSKINEGYVVIPLEKKRIKLRLSEKIENEIKKKIPEIKEVVKRAVPPPATDKPYCKRCAYRELCKV